VSRNGGPPSCVTQRGSPMLVAYGLSAMRGPRREGSKGCSPNSAQVRGIPHGLSAKLGQCGSTKGRPSRGVTQCGPQVVLPMVSTKGFPQEWFAKGVPERGPPRRSPTSVPQGGAPSAFPEGFPQEVFRQGGSPVVSRREGLPGCCPKWVTQSGPPRGFPPGDVPHGGPRGRSSVGTPRRWPQRWSTVRGPPGGSPGGLQVAVPQVCPQSVVSHGGPRRPVPKGGSPMCRSTRMSHKGGPPRGVA
jgi:hypothetical protein